MISRDTNVNMGGPNMEYSVVANTIKNPMAINKAKMSRTRNHKIPDPIVNKSGTRKKLDIIYVPFNAYRCGAETAQRLLRPAPKGRTAGTCYEVPQYRANLYT